MYINSLINKSINTNLKFSGKRRNSVSANLNIPAAEISEREATFRSNYLKMSGYLGLSFGLMLIILDRVSNSYNQPKYKVCYSEEYGYDKKDPDTVVIIDDFEKKIDLDGDKIPDISHGDLVRFQIKPFLPSCKVICYDQESFTMNSILKDIAAKVRKGEKIKGINISLSDPMPIEILSREIDPNINEWNIDKYRDKILEFIDLSKKEEIRRLNMLIKKGIKIFIGAGNNSKNSEYPGFEVDKGFKYFNILALAKGANVVGALSHGEKADYSYNNSLVNCWKDGNLEVGPEYKINPVKVKVEFEGMDINEDNIPDVPASQLSNPESQLETPLHGTSIASPRALTSYFRKKIRKPKSIPWAF